MPADPSIAIVIPTRDRLAYLEATLASIAEQARAFDAEVLVVDDAGPSPAARELTERFGARYEPHERPRGLNVARNTGVERSHGELVAFLDDDVRAAPGWLAALLDAAREHPEADVLAGRIMASLEGPAPRSCGREAPPVTTLDLGPRDAETDFAWGANMAIRRSALERVGPFDATLEHGGDEQEWQERLRASASTAAGPSAPANRRPAAPAPSGARTPAKVLYVAAAEVAHRRVGEDARLRALARTGHARGRAARRFDVRRSRAPSLARELLTLAGCLAHVLRRRCPAGLVMVAHSAGRLREALGERARPSLPASSEHAPDDDFLSGHSGTVGGLDALRREARDRLLDLRETASRRRLDRAARGFPAPARTVLALTVVREDPTAQAHAAAIRAELLASRHDVSLHARPPGELGKFANLDRLLAEHPAEGHDWLLVIDDDVVLPRGFLDRFLLLCERFDLTLAQPAHRLNSHAAWRVTRRRGGSLVRETRFVEIGPVTAFAARSFPVLLPFPAELTMGWGLDVHWAALAGRHGWRCGVLDAVTIAHRVAPAAQLYSRGQAVAQARAFLAERPYVTASEAESTLATHTRL